MDPFFRWMARNQKVMRICLAWILGTCLGILRLKTQMSWILLIPLLLWGVILLSTFVNYCYLRFQKRTMQIFYEQCDPYPFLDEIRTQFSYKLPPLHDTSLRINLAMALHNTGETQTAIDVMKNIQVDNKKAINSFSKVIYYNNLSVFYMETGDFAASEEAYRQFLELFTKLHRKAFEKQCNDMIVSAEAEHLYRVGQYAEALEMVKSAQLTTAHARVDGALFRAKCCIALGDQNTARQELNYVIDNGNKLAAVDKAWKMLKET